MEATTITTLEALRDALNGVPQVTNYTDIESWHEAVGEHARVHGLPMAESGDGIDYGSLPLIAGEPPSGCVGVWSCDAENLLVHDGERWRIVPRGESEGGAS